MNTNWAANKFVIEYSRECRGEDDTFFPVLETYTFSFNGSWEEALATFKAEFALGQRSFAFMGKMYQKQDFSYGNEYVWPRIYTLEEWFENNKTNRERV